MRGQNKKRQKRCADDNGAFTCRDTLWLILAKYLSATDHVHARTVCAIWRDLIPPPRATWWDACVSAARDGHTGLLEWLSAHSPACAEDTASCARAAAKRGHLDTLQWIVSSGWHWVDTDCARAAATRGHTHIVEWIVSSGAVMDGSVSDVAARHGQLDIVKLLHAAGAPCGIWVMIHAAARGHIEIAKWMWANARPEVSAPLEWEFIAGVAEDNGQHDVAGWLRSKIPYA